MNPVTALKSLLKTESLRPTVAGFVNIESGTISFAPERHIHELETSGAFGSQENCEACGVHHGFQMPSGMGDGLYTVAELKTIQGTSVGAITIFDTGTQFARNTGELARFDYPSFEIPADWDNRELTGIYLGSMTNSGKLFVSDATCGWPSTKSVLDIDIEGDALSAFVILENTPEEFEVYQDWLEENFGLRDGEDSEFMAGLLLENDDEGRYAGKRIRTHRSHVVRAMLVISAEFRTKLSSHFSGEIDLVELELSHLSGVERSHVLREDRTSSFANALLQLMLLRTGSSQDPTKVQSWLLQNAMSVQDEPGWTIIAENFPTGPEVSQIELAKMRWSVDEVSFETTDYSECEYCGSEFDSEEDLYCSDCGEKRGE